ncbi:polysaccharide lyase family 9 protein [Dothidotthia symphoricarpi CBS 119687]|uniref:Polysaccharide lyase family 9 protein n=1 Tax=Dothidotthia symphoricarpi CBS 119687 TaxID=1392245 RepID=A0A6A6A0V7_9PLEO|nr:polysaccharide lyase family 9 protein [Dothidotthia symphoricarpi CBS 119687]KAF2125632.1 polysaccharide lyase family 9 protein [Dothidotthia symphoricarpi CBS 119687]
MQLTMLQTVFLLLPSVLGATIYVAPTGSDSAAGSLAAPLKSIQTAVNKAVAGDTIFLRGGTYALTTNIQIKKSGTSAAPITLSAYQTEVPILDGEALTGTPAPVGGSLAGADRGVLHIEKANYWKFVGLELINGPYGVYADSSNNNVFERLVTRQNYETGFQLQGASANNKIYYLDSWGNRDPRKNGESADGIAIKEGSGEGNILKGARLWNNVDDGLDLWEFKSKITIVDTISWGNGFNRWSFTDFAGDGNGFKLGGGNAGDIGPADHNITNCIAFANAAKGFTDNSQTGNFVMLRNTAFNNPDVGFNAKNAVVTFRDNIAASNMKSTSNSAQVTLSSSQKLSGNSWSGSATWANSAFKSVDVSLVQGKRQANGKIAASDFLLPASGAAIGATTHWS